MFNNKSTKFHLRFTIEPAIATSAMIKLLPCVLKWFSIEAAIATATILKILPSILKRKHMIELHHKTLKINTYSKESSTEKKIAYKWISLQNKLISSMIISYFFLIALYCTYPIFRGVIYPLAPSIIPKELHKLPWNLLVYICEMTLLVLRIILLISCDMHLVVCMCQLCSELQIAGNAMLAINIHDKQSIYRAIQKHKRVLEYGHLICKEFSSSMVLQHCGMSIAGAFAAVSVLYTKEQTLVVEFTLIGLTIVAEILLLCFVGELIAEESLKITDYLEDKYQDFLDDVASLKTISFMLLRAQRPLSLRVGENTIINLNLFRITMQKIFSGFLILKRAMEV